MLRLRDPRDVASVGRTCRKLRRVVGEVPLRLRVQGGPETPETARGDVAAQLEGLVATFKNVVELEVLDASVTEDVVQATLDSLPELGWIHIQFLGDQRRPGAVHPLTHFGPWGDQGDTGLVHKDKGV